MMNVFRIKDVRPQEALADGDTHERDRYYQKSENAMRFMRERCQYDNLYVLEWSGDNQMIIGRTPHEGSAVPHYALEQLQIEDWD